MKSTPKVKNLNNVKHTKSEFYQVCDIESTGTIYEYISTFIVACFLKGYDFTIMVFDHTEAGDSFTMEDKKYYWKKVAYIITDNVFPLFDKKKLCDSNWHPFSF